jgi:cargo-transport protein YPP1
MRYYEKALDYWPNHATAIVGISNILLDIYEEKIPAEPPNGTGLNVNGFKTNGLSSTPTPSSQERRTQGATTVNNSANLSANPSANPSAVNSVLALGGRPETLSRTQTGSSIHHDTLSMDSQSHHDELREEDDDEQSTTADLDAGAIKVKGDDEPDPDYLDRLAARDRAYFLLSTLTKLGTGWDYSEAWFALARAHELSGQLEKAKDIYWYTVALEDSRPLRGWEAVK